MKQKALLEDKYAAINTLETDFRAEAVAAGLIESGIDADKILIVRQMGDKRYVSKDIAEIKKGFSQQDLMEYLYIHTNRPSIYDAIPENIFHQPFNTAKKKSQEDIIYEIRRHRQEEYYARRFFQPFEMAIDQILTDAQLYERQFDKKNFHGNLRNIFSSYWDILKLFTLKQAVYFIKVIPVIHRISTDFEKMSRLISVVLEVPVKIELGGLSRISTGASSMNLSGGWKLGVNTVVGNSFRDGYRDIDITIGPISPEQMRLFSKGLKNNLILEQLMGMILPADCQRVYSYKVDKEHTRFRLSDDTHTAYLGINTKL